MDNKNNYFIHPKAIVDTKDIGKDTRIWAFVHILSRVKIGLNCNICDFCFIENGVSLGNNVTVKSGVYLWEGITIKDGVFIGPNVTFTNDIKPRSKDYPENYLKTTISEGASLGANSTILPGITIGKYAMTGAGSVVTRNVEDFNLVIGNPARFKSYICKCTAEINFKNNKYSCNCGEEYKLENNKVKSIK